MSYAVSVCVCCVLCALGKKRFIRHLLLLLLQSHTDVVVCARGDINFRDRSSRSSPQDKKIECVYVCVCVLRASALTVVYHPPAEVTATDRAQQQICWSLPAVIDLAVWAWTLVWRETRGWGQCRGVRAFFCLNINCNHRACVAPSQRK